MQALTGLTGNTQDAPREPILDQSGRSGSGGQIVIGKKTYDRYLEVKDRRLPLWLIATYDGAVNDLLDDIVSGQYAFLFADKVVTEDVRERAVAEAKGAALFRLGDGIDELRQEAILRLLRESQEEGWYRSISSGSQEYDSATELIREFSAREAERSISFSSNMTFVLDELVPVFEQLQVPPEIVIGLFAKKSKTKMREAVPQMRALLKVYQSGGMSGKEFKDTLLEMLDDILNPKVRKKQFLQKYKEQTERTIEIEEVGDLDVGAYLVDQDTFLVAMKVSTRQLETIRLLLSSHLKDIPVRNIGHWFQLAVQYLPFRAATRDEKESQSAFDQLIAVLLDQEQAAGYPTLSKLNGTEK